MRRLFRPTLFMIARLGLFLAVLASIVGQWQETKCCILISNSEFDVGNCARGWKFEYMEFFRATKSGFEVVREADSVDTLRFGEDFEITMDQLDGGAVGPMPASVSFNIAGVVVGQVWGQAFLTIRHWLVGTIFALFNGVLMWVYRKRGKELADE